MINETIAQLEARLKNSTSISEQNRQELLTLLATLRTEVSDLSKTHAEDAAKILTYAQDSTREATRQPQDTDRLNTQLQNLSSSVDGFEKSHPQLVQIVNRIAETLANLGI